jgi:hypothetical protein
MKRDCRGQPIFDEADIAVELGRLQYAGNTAKVYLPQKVREALRLDPQKDNALVMIYDDESGILILVPNKLLCDRLRPEILEARRKKKVIEGAK